MPSVQCIECDNKSIARYYYEYHHFNALNAITSEQPTTRYYCEYHHFNALNAITSEQPTTRYFCEYHHFTAWNSMHCFRVQHRKMNTRQFVGSHFVTNHRKNCGNKRSNQLSQDSIRWIRPTTNNNSNTNNNTSQTHPWLSSPFLATRG